MTIIKIDLVLDKALHFDYSDGTYVEYIISENPFEAGSYNAHVSFGKVGDKSVDNHIEVYFPRHSLLSHEYLVNGKVFKLKLNKTIY